MSVNVYLHEEIRKAEGFGMKTKIWGKPPQSHEQATFMGIELSMSEGRLSLHLSYLDDKIPEVLLLLVSDVSFHGCLPLQPRRETGVYRDEDKFGDAVAKLEVNSSNYFLRITGMNLEQVRMLYEAVRAGTVRPAESWEQPQMTRPRDELEADLAASRRDLEHQRNECFRLRDSLSEERMRVASVRDIVTTLDCQKRRLCFKKTVADQIRQAID